MEIFHSQLPIRDFWARLQIGGIFRRGLPLPRELQKPFTARVLRKVLANNQVRDGELQNQNQKNALQMCFRNGWLHAAMDNDTPVYIFATPLHQGFIEHYLGNQPSNCTTIANMDLLDLSIEVIRLFSPHQLSQRKLGASAVQRPPEAQFQDEFYRCFHKYTNGSLISYSEYGNASGRIDFYIPVKEWGGELTREGDRLKNHHSRFIGSGAYTKLSLKDNIILDFRTTPPQKRHPG